MKLPVQLRSFSPKAPALTETASVRQTRQAPQPHCMHYSPAITHCEPGTSSIDLGFLALSKFVFYFVLEDYISSKGYQVQSSNSIQPFPLLHPFTRQ